MRMIDADKIVEEINKHGLEVLSKGGNALKLGCYATGLVEAMDIINSSETIDPVKHGSWIFIEQFSGGYYGYECSECHHPENVQKREMLGNYCSYCGAKMDQEEEGNHDH